MDEAVPPGVGHEPLLGGGVLLLVGQILHVGVHDVHRQTQLVLAGAGNGHGLGRLHLGLLLAHAAVDQPLYLVVVQTLLRLLRPVGGAQERAVARRLAGVHHLLEGLVAPAVDLPAVAERHQIRRPAVRQRVPRVHQRQQLVVHLGLVVHRLQHVLCRLVLILVHRGVVLLAALDNKYRTHDNARQQHGGDDAVAHGLPVALLPAAFSFVIHSVTSILRGRPPSRVV